MWLGKKKPPFGFKGTLTSLREDESTLLHKWISEFSYTIFARYDFTIRDDVNINAKLLQGQIQGNFQKKLN